MASLKKDNPRFVFVPDAWRRRTEQIRDLGLALVPVLYVLGFLAWSMFFWRSRLGFHALPAPQYLLAGTLLVLFVGPLCLAEAWLHSHSVRMQSDLTPGTSLKFSGAIFLLRVAVTALWFMLVGSILSPFKIVDLTPLQFIVMGLLIGLFAAAFLFMLPGVLTRRRRVKPKSTADSSEESLTRALSRTERGVSMGLPIFLWALLGIYTMGYLIIDHVEPEFGGGMGRHAYLGLDAGQVPAELVSLVAESNRTTGVVWTSEVNVVFQDAQNIVITVDGSSPHGSRYELDRSLVKVIAWTDLD